MRRAVLPAVVLLAATACGSHSAAPADPSAAADLARLSADLADTGSNCGDPTARFDYQALGNHRFVVVGHGRFSCGHGGPGGRTPTGTVLTMWGAIDKYGTFVQSEFSLATIEPTVSGLHPLPSAATTPGEVPVDLIRELVVKAATNCGDPHPTDIAYVRTTMQAADVGPGVTDYTIPAGKRPVYAVIAHGRFTCRHWAIHQPVPAVRTRLRMVLPADGSGLEPLRIGIDADSSRWPDTGAATPLS